MYEVPVLQARPRVLDDGAMSAAQPRTTIASLALVVPVVLGLVLRLIAANRLTLQIDEAASLLGGIAVAERGIPILPSGTLYLHGATLSYLLAPLVRLGFDGLADLHALRLLNALIGSLAVILTYRLGLLATGRPWLAWAAALLVAVDPISVQWSGHLRMYALLQVLTLAIALTFLRALDEGERIPVLMVALFAIAAFTHVGIALLWPPMVLIAVLLCGATLLDANRGLGIGLLLCPIGPLIFLAANRAFAPPRRDEAASGFGSILDEESFLNPERLVRPSLWVWRALFRDDWYAGLMPALLVVLTGIVIARFLLGDPPAGPERPGVIGALLALHWIPVLLIGLLTTERQPRYTMNIWPFGLVVIVLALTLVAQAGWIRRRKAPRVAASTLVAVGLAVAVIVINRGQGLISLLHTHVVEPDYGAALDYVAAERRPDEVVFATMPPPAFLALGRDNLVFLAGREGTVRTSNYTQLAADGRLVDYWVGVDAIDTVGGICDAFAAHPGAWVLGDEMRFTFLPAFGHPVSTIIRDATTEVFRGGMDALVLRVDPVETWGAAAHLCAEASRDEGDAAAPALPPPPLPSG